MNLHECLLVQYESVKMQIRNDLQIQHQSSIAVSYNTVSQSKQVISW